MKTLLFDLDGTLTDPKEGITRCIAHAMARMGTKPPPLEELHFAIGPPLRPTFARLLATEDPISVEQAIVFYRERFATIGLFENALYANIRNTLKSLQQRGHTLYLATSKPHVFATRILTHFEIAEHFVGIYGSELNGTRDDKGELIAHLLAQEKLSPETCLMIGDRKHDVIGAAKNSVPALGVTWGYGSREELQKAGAVALCEAPREILKWSA